MRSYLTNVLTNVHICFWAVVGFAGCGKGVGGDDGAEVKLNFVNASSSLLAVNLDERLAKLDLTSYLIAPLAVGDYGEASVGTAGLTSFKMYFREIKICENLEISGSGYSSQQGCVTVYQNMTDQYGTTYDTRGFTREQALAAGTGKYYDILSAADRASLTQTVSVPAGEYNYGIIEAHHYVKLTAKVPRTAGDLCTKADATEEATADSNGYVHVKAKSTSLDCGGAAAQETAVYLPSSNTNFKFLKPFKVESGDSVELDLAFNLDKEVKGGYGSGEVTNSAESVGIRVPMIRMVPVPRKSGQTTKVESYEFTPAGATEFKVRAELYYNSDDTSKSVLAAMLSVIGTSQTNQDIAGKPFYAYSASQSGDTLTFKSWDGSTTMSFDRISSGTGSGTLSCPKHNSTTYAFDNSQCGSDTVNVSYSAPTVYTVGE